MVEETNRIPPAPAAAAAESVILAHPRLRPTQGRAAPVRIAEWVSYQVARVTTVLSLLLTLGLIGCLLLQVFFRYVLNQPLAWTDEAAIFLFAWTMLLLASVAVRERIHVRFTFLVELLPRPLARALDLLTMSLIVGFGVLLVSTGMELVELVWGNLSPAVHYPLQILYISMPVQGVLLALHAGTNLMVGPVAERGAL